MTEVREDA